MRFSDKQLLQVARKYNLIPGSLKNKVFLLLEQGRSLEEIRFLLRRYRNPDRQKRLPGPSGGMLSTGGICRPPAGRISGGYTEQSHPLPGRKRKVVSMERGFKVILEWDREGNTYHVSVPALPGCFTYGRTREEALQRAREAIQGHLKGLKLIGEPVPEGDVDIDEVLVNIT